MTSPEAVGSDPAKTSSGPGEQGGLWQAFSFLSGLGDAARKALEQVTKGSSPEEGATEGTSRDLGKILMEFITEASGILKKGSAEIATALSSDEAAEVFAKGIYAKLSAGIKTFVDEAKFVQFVVSNKNEIKARMTGVPVASDKAKDEGVPPAAQA